MPGRRWTTAEGAQLEHLAGNVPGPLIPRAFNAWAREHGIPQRTPVSVKRQIERRHLSLRVCGDWITTGVIAHILGISLTTPLYWIQRGILPARQFHRSSRQPWFIRRADVVALARQRPELFGGIERGRLAQLLENERLADQITAEHHRRQNTPRRVRCVETGRLYRSTREAARAVFVARQLIQRAISTGRRAGGFHWRLDELSLPPALPTAPDP